MQDDLINKYLSEKNNFDSFVALSFYSQFNPPMMVTVSGFSAWFAIPLVIGFASDAASAFTTLYSEKWGKARGTLLTIVLRNITGIPVWVTGFVLAIHESEGFLFKISLLTRTTGWLLILTGALIIVTALVRIRLKSAAPSTGDTLVNKGIYSIIRHPIHSGTFLEFTGLFILQPSFQTGLAAVLGCIWIFIQTRFEEQDLIQRIPEYRDYLKQVPRFLPSLFRKR
jgi:protein-S-isoprenylcysteine O-methyltransferase Ste14